MFCDFYFDSDYSFEKQKKMILNKVIHSPVIRLYDSIDEMLLRNSKIEELVIVFDAFCFEMTPVQDYEKFKAGEYNIKIDIQVHFDIYSDVADWDKEMMKLLNYLIRYFVNNCVLEYYAIPVLKIINGNVEIDESKSGRSNSLPFDILESGEFYAYPPHLFEVVEDGLSNTFRLAINANKNQIWNILKKRYRELSGLSVNSKRFILNNNNIIFDYNEDFDKEMSISDKDGYLYYEYYMDFYPKEKELSKSFPVCRTIENRL